MCNLESGVGMSCLPPRVGMSANNIPRNSASLVFESDGYTSQLSHLTHHSSIGESLFANNHFVSESPSASSGFQTLKTSTTNHANHATPTMEKRFNEMQFSNATIICGKQMPMTKNPFANCPLPELYGFGTTLRFTILQPL